MSNWAETKSRRVTLLRMAGTLLSAGLLLYLLKQQGWSEIRAALSRIPAGYFILALCLMIVSRFAVITRWHTLLRSADLTVSYRDTARITFAGLFASNFLPTTIGGDVIRLIGALQLHLDTPVATASLIADRLVGMAGMAVMLPFGLISLLSAPLLAQPPSNLSTILKPVLSSTSIIKESWWKKVVKKGLLFLKQLLSSLAIWLKQPVALVKSLGWNALHMLCLFTVIYLLLTGMSERVSLLQIGGLYSLVYFVTLVPISINGYGLQEISITLVFSNLAGVSTSSSLTMALLFRTIMMLASLPGALFITSLMPAAGQRTETEQVVAEQLPPDTP